MDTFEQHILEYLARPDYAPVKPAKLASRLHLPKRLVPQYSAALERLVASGRVREGRKGKLHLATTTGLIAGILKRISSGAAFVIPHEQLPHLGQKDIFISAADARDAHTGDEVLVSLLKRRGAGGKRTGRVEEVLERATSSFVGVYFERDGQSYVQVDGTAFQQPIIVDDPGAKGAQPDDKVCIEMLRFPTNFQRGEAVLTKVLGPRGQIGVDTQSIIHEFGLPHEFSEDVLTDARRQADAFSDDDLDGRLDLTKETIVTIDPVDARDFDDAISLSRDSRGHWRLGVHIADVAHFVRPGSPLDIEARSRGTSIYLPRHVIPMLPEVISNALASLQKGKVRYTKSAFIEFTPDGIPVASEFARSAIKVTQRFAYEEVLPVVKDPEEHRASVGAKVRQLLGRMHELAMILRARRFAAGALELDLPEVKIDFDKQGAVTGAHESVHDESHQIIEEFMLAANVAVATELADRGLPFLRRVHGDPDVLKLRRYAEFVALLGYKLKNFQSRPELQALLNRVKGEPVERAVNYALLRSMRQAEYTAEELGHYALAVENYCHFTSPIRRYPDLTVHRLLDMIFDTKHKAKHADESELMKLGRHCSITERRAAAAERELTKVKLLTYMSQHVGEEFDAVITGVEQFGIFCQGIEIPVEGLVHISALDRGEAFYHDPASMSLIGRRKGTKYRLGNRVRVVVALVDVDRRVLDLRIAATSGQQPQLPLRRTQRDGRTQKLVSPRRVAHEPTASTPADADQTDRKRGRRKASGTKQKPHAEKGSSRPKGKKSTTKKSRRRSGSRRNRDV
ncbi:MAG: ribonuclease R [Planctomycetaceae bacterium]